MIKTVSWNTECRLSSFAEDSERGSPTGVVSEIERLDGDIVFLPEAYDGARPVRPEIMQRLQSDLGYTALSAHYNDSGSREFAAAVDPHMLFLSRLQIEQAQELRLGDVRNALVVDVVSRDGDRVRVIGVHLDDRSEENRIKQVEDLIPLVMSTDSSAIVMGDFNAMHRESLPARMLRTAPAKSTAQHWPHARTKDIMYRLMGMAAGDTMDRILSETNLTDIDSGMRPTTTPKMRGQEWMPSIRMVQIDHILVSSGVKATSFTVSRDGGSDHRAISATLAIN